MFHLQENYGNTTDLCSTFSLVSSPIILSNGILKHTNQLPSLPALTEKNSTESPSSTSILEPTPTLQEKVQQHLSSKPVPVPRVQKQQT